MSECYNIDDVAYLDPLNTTCMDGMILTKSLGAAQVGFAKFQKILYFKF